MRELFTAKERRDRERKTSEAFAKPSTTHLNRRNQERTENNFSVASAASCSKSMITGFGPVFFIRGIGVICGQCFLILNVEYRMLNFEVLGMPMALSKDNL
jgi:hypothetical protein